MVKGWNINLNIYFIYEAFPNVVLRLNIYDYMLDVIRFMQLIKNQSFSTNGRAFGVGCHVTLAHTIHVGECVLIIGMHHLKMNMVEEWLHLDVVRKPQGMHPHH